MRLPVMRLQRVGLGVGCSRVLSVELSGTELVICGEGSGARLGTAVTRCALLGSQCN